MGCLQAKAYAGLEYTHCGKWPNNIGKHLMRARTCKRGGITYYAVQRPDVTKHGTIHNARTLEYGIDVAP